MQPYSFTATTAAEALEQIRTSLGPEAVVLNVRPLPANGISRLWQKPMIEVLAYKPEEQAVEAAPISQALVGYIEQLKEVRHETAAQAMQAAQMEIPAQMKTSATLLDVIDTDRVEITDSPDSINNTDSTNWRVGELLEKTGFLPVSIQRVIDQLRSQYGENPPASLGDEISLMRRVLENSWKKPRPFVARTTHVLIGPAGSGKTTSLCKWLTQAALMEGRTARVWRLNSAMANMAEALSVYCEILGVPSERTWDGTDRLTEDVGFIDLPGIDWRQPMAVKELGSQLKQLGSPQVHLVLNGAYDTSVLLAQIRAFSCLPIEDLIITHLDEETRWGKLWNLALGTNYSIRSLSTGQNIPGDYCEASAEIILNRQFPRK